MTTVPFGVEVASRVPDGERGEVDPAAFVYDTDRQMALIVQPTAGVTQIRTASDGAGGPEWAPTWTIAELTPQIRSEQLPMAMDSTVVPFGIAVASRPGIPLADADQGMLVYDSERQLMLADDGTGTLSPVCDGKHSTGPTRPVTGTDGQNGPEYDDDYTED